MPKMPLSAEHKAKNNYDFPKLFLEKGERARIILLDPVPHTEYVHTMRAPQVVNGKPVMEVVDGKERMKYDFVGRHICLGDFDTISDKGVDVQACPVCAESKKSDAVKPPERRHALNVIRYKTQPGGFKPQEPFMVELVVWAFADKVHSQLIDYADEWGDLRAHDLTLGPCEVKMYQKMEINVASKAEWMADDARKSLTAEVFKNNMLADLTVAIGRKLSKEMVMEDLAKVMERHNVAYGKVSASPTEAIEVDVDDILVETPATSAPVPSDEDDTEKAPAAKAPAAAPAGDVDLMDLEDILNM